FLLTSCVPHHTLHSFPTRRSSDLLPGFAGESSSVQFSKGIFRVEIARDFKRLNALGSGIPFHTRHFRQGVGHSRHAFESAGCERDRKSTRLNSSHGSISYAVFCLK